MTIRVVVTGVRGAQRDLRRLRARETRAKASALGKTTATARSRLRRALSAREQIPLKLTRKRVAWFWKARRGARRAETKLWVGTRWAIGPAELPRLARRPRGERTIDLAEAADQLVGRIARATFRTEFPKQLASQLRRFR